MISNHATRTEVYVRHGLQPGRAYRVKPVPKLHGAPPHTLSGVLPAGLYNHSLHHSRPAA